MLFNNHVGTTFQRVTFSGNEQAPVPRQTQLLLRSWEGLAFCTAPSYSPEKGAHFVVSVIPWLWLVPPAAAGSPCLLGKLQLGPGEGLQQHGDTAATSTREVSGWP